MYGVSGPTYIEVHAIAKQQFKEFRNVYNRISQEDTSTLFQIIQRYMHLNRSASGLVSKEETRICNTQSDTKPSHLIS